MSTPDRTACVFLVRPSVCGLAGSLFLMRFAFSPAVRAACPVDIAAFYLNDGTDCGRHAATQTLLSGFACSLDDRGVQLDPSKDEYIPNSPLDADSQPPEAPLVGLFVTTEALALWAPPSGSHTITCATSRRSCTESRPFSPPPPLSFFSASASGVPDHLSCLEDPLRQYLPLVRSNAEQPTLIASAACSQSPLPPETWLRARASIKKGILMSSISKFRESVQLQEWETTQNGCKVRCAQG